MKRKSSFDVSVSNDKNEITSYLQLILNRKKSTSKEENTNPQSVSLRVKELEEKNQLKIGKKSISFYKAPTNDSKTITKLTEKEKKFEKEIIKQIKETDDALKEIESGEITFSKRKEHYELKVVQQKQQKLYQEFKKYETSTDRLNFYDLKKKCEESEKERLLLEEMNKKLKEELDKFVKYQKLNLKVKQYENEIENMKQIEEKILNENSSLKERLNAMYNSIHNMFEEKEILLRQQNATQQKYETLNEKYEKLKEDYKKKDKSDKVKHSDFLKEIEMLKLKNENLSMELEKKNEILSERNREVESLKSLQLDHESMMIELNTLKKEKDFFKSEFEKYLGKEIHHGDMKKERENYDYIISKLKDSNEKNLSKMSLEKSKSKASFFFGEFPTEINSKEKEETILSFEDFKENKERIEIFQKYSEIQFEGEKVQFLFDIYNFKEESKSIEIQQDVYKQWYLPKLNSSLGWMQCTWNIFPPMQLLL
jgi:hypothetical protein